MHVLFVTWQAPESRRFFPIARVMRRSGGEYEWAYLRAVSEALGHGFTGLPGYEDLDRVVRSSEPPALFAHRVPARGRRRPPSAGQQPFAPQPANDSFDPAPITLLVPAGAGRYERLEVFGPPLPGSRGQYWGVFVARGVGRVPGAADVVSRLEPREVLGVRSEPDNPVNPSALLLSRADGTPVGYVPDYLANEVAAALEAGPGVLAVAGTAPGEGLRVEVQSAERVNQPPADPIFHVLCQYSCAQALGERLFHSERYQARAPAP
jgi:hypothetical protein